MTASPKIRLALLALLVVSTLGAARLASWRMPAAAGGAAGGSVAHGAVAGGGSVADGAVAAAAQAGRIEVAFVLDATGSMSGLIDGARRKIWEIADRMSRARGQVDLRVALVAYRDRGDHFVTRRVDLTRDLDALFGELAQLRAEGGGDGPESVNQALHEAVTALDWSRGRDVYRVVFLVGDAPPHMDYADDVPWSESVAAARQRGIVVNTIQCGDHAQTLPVWQAIAAAAGGRYAAIAQDGNMLAVETPVDDELARLNRELAATVLPYGDADARRELAAKRDRALAAPAPAAASRLGYLARLGRVVSGRRDLVDAVKEGEVDVTALPDAALPETLQGLAPEAREAAVKAQLEKRERLQARVAELSREREAHLAEARAERARAGERGFDEEVMDAVRSQAAAAGIVYE